jgi:hypothetical protein
MARPKEWFDQRAEDGFYWTITVKKHLVFDLEGNGGGLNASCVELLYTPIKVLDAYPIDVRQYGKMTQDEAIAMAKLLNASETN